MATKSEIRAMYSLNKDEKALAVKLHSQVNPNKRIEYLDLLEAAGFNGKKIRAVAHEKELRFEKNSNPQVVHILRVAKAVFEGVEEHRDFHTFCSVCMTVLSALGYKTQRKWIECILTGTKYHHIFNAPQIKKIKVKTTGGVAEVECQYHVQIVFESGEVEFLSRGKILEDTDFGISDDDLLLLHEAVEQYWLENPPYEVSK